MNDGLDFLFEGIAAGQPERPVNPIERRWPRRLRRLALTAIILVSAGTVGVLATSYLTSTDLISRVSRVGEVFGGTAETERPVADPAATRGRTILAIGAEPRVPEQNRDLDTQPTAEPSSEPEIGPDDNPAGEPGQTDGVVSDRGTLVMLIRFDPGDHSASVVSIPPQTRVEVPGHGSTTISAAHALGDPALLVRTVEQLTSIRIDHFMMINFDELAPVVDVLNGVDVAVGAAVTDPTGVRFRAGVNHLDGAQALAYLRQPDLLPDGTLDRMQRQQNLLRAVLTKVASIRSDVNALESYRLLDAATRAVSVDDRVSREELGELARGAAALETGKIWFLVAPVRDTDSGTDRTQPDRSTQLWRAFNTGAIAEYVTEHPEDLLSSNVG